MFKKVKKLIETNIVGRYEDLEKRYTAFEDRLYTSLDQRLSRLESRIDALSQAIQNQGPLEVNAEGQAAETQETSTQQGQAAVKLEDLKGLGPVMLSRLAECGVQSLEDLAALDEAALDRIEAQIKGFKVRCQRYDWIAQARELLGDA